MASAYRHLTPLISCLTLLCIAIPVAAMQPPPARQSKASSEISLRPAYDACVSGGGTTTAAVLRCAYDEFTFQDKRLNAAYKMLMSRLEATEKTSLRNEERKWLADKKQRCALHEDSGTTDQVVAADCEVTETARRAAELEIRLKK